MKTKETLKTDKQGYLLLPEKFEFKGYSFEFVKNIGNWKIYKKSKEDSHPKYEIIKPIKQEEFNFRGNLLPKKWTYPGTNAFGRNGYDCISIERCEELYKNWILPREQKNEEKNDEVVKEKSDLVYSKDKFTIKDLEILNKKLTYAQISVKLKEDLVQGKIKIVGEKENPRGRASKIYKLK